MRMMTPGGNVKSRKGEYRLPPPAVPSVAVNGVTRRAAASQRKPGMKTPVVSSSPSPRGFVPENIESRPVTSGAGCRWRRSCRAARPSLSVTDEGW